MISGSNVFIFLLFLSLPFVVFVGLVNQAIEGFVHMTVFNGVPDLLDHIDKLLSDDIVDPESQGSDYLVGLLQVSVLAVQLVLHNLSLLLVSSDFLHQYVLTVNKLQPFL